MYPATQLLPTDKPQTMGQKLTAITLAARARAQQAKTLCEHSGISVTSEEKPSLTKTLVGKGGWWYKTATLPHKNSVEKIMFDSSGTHISTIIDNSNDNSDDETSSCWFLAHIWNRDTAQLNKTISVQAMDFNSDALKETSVQMALVDDSHVRIMDSDGNVSFSIPLDESTKDVKDVTLYPARDWVSVQLRDDRAILWNYKSGKMILDKNSRKIVCNPKGTHIGSLEKVGIYSYSAYLYNGTTIQKVAADVSDLTFNPQQDMLATVQYNGVSLWDFDGKQLHTVPHPTVNFATFNPQGTQLATAAWDGTVCLWDSNTGEALHTFCSNKSMAPAAFAPQGNMLAVPSNTYVDVWQQHEQPTLEQVLLWNIIQKWLQTVTAEKKTTEFACKSEKDIPFYIPFWMATQFNLQKDELEKVWYTMPLKLRNSIFNTIIETLAPVQIVDEVTDEDDLECMPGTEGVNYASIEKYLPLYDEDDAPQEKVDLFL